MTAPYTSVSVQLPAPSSPYGDERVSVNWSATRFSSGLTEVIVGVFAGGRYTRLGSSDALTLPVVADWVPRPPAGWLASLRMTAEPDQAEPDLIAQASAAMDIPADPAVVARIRAILDREGRK